MVYNVSSRILTTDKGEKIKLTRLHNLMLICLSNNRNVTREELEEFTGCFNISKLKHDFLVRVKHKIKIRTLVGIGYRLESEIYFE